ncbi:MAG TPA: hypothetical protein VGK84_06175 [Candidatus Tumulicola sp.]
MFEKLGVRAEHRVALVGKHDDGFVRELDVRLAKGASPRLRARYDIIFLKIDRVGDLASIEVAATHLEMTGVLWIFHPKGRDADPKDVAVRAASFAAGLVGNKISAYSETHTATRYVIPVANRG